MRLNEFRFCFFAALLALSSGRPLHSYEAGFIVENEFKAEIKSGGESGEANRLLNDAKAGLWMSFKPSEISSLYIKGYGVIKNGSIMKDAAGWKVSGGLDLFRFALVPVPSFYIEFGRVHYSDALRFIADSSFDGGSIGFNIGNHAFAFAAYYTALLTKEQAKIMLSPEDKNDYYKSGYFAPPHLILSLKYLYYPYFLQDSFFEVNVLRQSDLHDGAEYETFYALSKASIGIGTTNFLNLGIVFSFLQSEGEADFALSAFAEYIIRLNNSYPSSINFQLNMFYGSFSEPKSMPVINTFQAGRVFNPELARLASINVQYLARFVRTLSVDIGFSLFMRLSTDYTPASDMDVNKNSSSAGLLLGEEIALGIIWTPASDFSLNIGFEFFLPDTGSGSIYNVKTPITNDLRLGFILSF